MQVTADQFVTSTHERVLTDEGLPGMRGMAGIGSTSETHQGQIAAALYANCAHLNDCQLDEVIKWVRLYQK